MLNLVTDEKSFTRVAMSFYNNQQCNSIEEFEEDLAKISLIKAHFCRYQQKETTNFRLMMNHFISFVNCFGIISEELLKYKIPDIHYDKIDSLFVILGYKSFDGTVKINEKFFIDTNKGLRI
jgi:hypothetical protein